MRRLAIVLVALALAGGVGPVPAEARPVPQAPSCPDFPADSHWHADVSRLPVHPRSDDYVASMGLDSRVHPDFGSGTYDGGPIGIPYTVADSSTPRVAVSFDYDDESDPGPYPIPPSAPIEGGPQSDGDRHVLVVDRSACRLYELFDAHPNPNGSWHAGSGATWDLRSNALRPDSWTSADAAGLPILPGLVRYDEVVAGEIDHAIRVTARSTQAAHLWPARHHAGSANADLPPMGLRLRLRNTYDIGRFPIEVRMILQAMQTYGLIVADNGSSWFLTGAPDERWDNDALATLHQLHGSDFEAVDASSLMADPNSGRVRGGAATPAPQPAPVPSDAALARFVDAVYQDFLGRAPDAGGRSFWLDRLRAGMPRGELTTSIARSPEWLGRTVAGLYELALARPPDAGGLDHWRARLAAGTPVADLAATLLGSDEAFALGGGTPGGYVDRLYQRVLGRAADAAGRAYWADAIRAGTPRTLLAGSLFQSAEHRSARVAFLYAVLLDRPPDAGGRAFWVDALLRVDDVVLAALLAGSDEYFARA